ncbi:hypothetical protein C5167_044076 [Papaver somniferum]|uniref:Uncharacterized protein n=1 Tax=Papaver somniferum TaxID=3469 RepID=A0A4Y7L7K8_PAPSO|nr:hypothetical protein C5167_044076 [Papaver somniferum]
MSIMISLLKNIVLGDILSRAAVFIIGVRNPSISARFLPTAKSGMLEWVPKPCTWQKTLFVEQKFKFDAPLPRLPQSSQSPPTKQVIKSVESWVFATMAKQFNYQLESNIAAMAKQASLPVSFLENANKVEAQKTKEGYLFYHQSQQLNYLKNVPRELRYLLSKTKHPPPPPTAFPSTSIAFITIHHLNLNPRPFSPFATTTISNTTPSHANTTSMLKSQHHP